ncbi:hypothetical protein OIDMADRAFT_40863 [Oidiodendron maius Zn]|uniref:Rhodopsin domain-containing protein n=1 Tax=Oidiodendron maius (strain Zn) TaxID=913774 RepID=A0A0C3DMP2_OIDMZ|nr:hypothetical protein OIDMADRAFT_40863 [Oidiodendron maius Zn]
MDQFVLATLVTPIVFLAVATIFVALRLISRLLVAHRITLSDYLMLVGWALTCSLSAVIMFATTKGIGLREGVLPEWKVPLAKTEYVFTVLYFPALTAIKSSILVFYLTLSSGQYLFRIGTCLTLGFVNIVGLVLTVVSIAQCVPISAAFRVSAPPGANCIDIVAFFISTTPVNIITDFAIFFLPLPSLWRVRLPVRQKIILLITFGTGLFVTIISVIRTVSILHVAIARVTQLNPPGVHDLSYYDAYVFLWSAVELNLGIMVGCVPFIKPLVAKVLPSLVLPKVTSGLRNKDPTTSGSTCPPQFASPACTTAQADIETRDINRDTRGLFTPETDVTLSSAISEDQHSGAPQRGPRRTTSQAPLFDFVALIHPKSMLQMSGKECLAPVIVMCVVFFLSGFAYGFINVLNEQFRRTAGLTQIVCSGLHASYFGAYAFGPILVARPVLKRWGFKATLVTGLSIYSCGTLVFWPASILVSLPAFLVANFIVGLGLSVAETSLDLFITLCGPPNYSEVRLNIAKGVQAIGGVISPIVAQQVVNKYVNDAPGLIRAQWTYLVMTIVAILVAVAYNFLPLPEVNNNEFANHRQEGYCNTIYGIRVVWVTLILGVLSQFCNIGGQEGLQTQFRSLVAYNEATPDPQAFVFLDIGHALFAIGSFLAASAQIFFKPRYVLFGLYLGMILFSILTLTTTGYTGITMGLLLFLFNGGVFSITFTISLRGIGEHIKTAASIMTMAMAGGSFSIIQAIVSEHHGSRYAFSVVVALFSLGAIFPVYLNLVPAARKQVDPVTNEYLDH